MEKDCNLVIKNTTPYIPAINGGVLRRREINKYLNQSTLRIFKQGFNDYLLDNAINQFSIGYQSIRSTVHPTKLTDANGMVMNEINSYDIGGLYSEDKVNKNYLFDELFYDSELEKENIIGNINDVIIFTKIPKNSIKIPVAGSKSYSPDFAYVLNFEDGSKKLYFVVETKGKNERGLETEELKKIKYAEEFFKEIKVKFTTQFNGNKMVKLIQEAYDQEV